MFDRVQILPNTLKHVETCLNSTKQGGQTEKCFAKQQCFSMFYRKTFTVWTGLNNAFDRQNHMIERDHTKYHVFARSRCGEVCSPRQYVVCEHIAFCCIKLLPRNAQTTHLCTRRLR